MSQTPRPITPDLTPDQRDALTAYLDAHVEQRGPDECWPWTGGGFTGGYPVFTFKVGTKFRVLKAHRAIFELLHGPTPLTVDHLCHDHATCEPPCVHRQCCNPAHLGAASLEENAGRAQRGRYRETCRHGHAMTPENTYETPDGPRQCRTCNRERTAAARRESRRGSALPAGRRSAENRPRGMSLRQLVEWGLDGQEGDACFYWRGKPRLGYTNVRVGARSLTAHRLVYEVLVGPVPTGHDVDHTCHDPQTCAGGHDCPHRGCVNPRHLRAVTAKVNSSPQRAKRLKPDSCAYGHLFTPENTWTASNGSRQCKTCNRERAAETYHREREDKTDGRYRQDGRCPNGHLIEQVGLSSDGRCKQCRRDRSAEFKARQRAAAAS